MAEPLRENTYHQVVRAILALDATASAKVLLLYLYDRQGTKGYSWPSLSTICRDCKTTRPTTVRALKELEDAKVLKISRPKRPSVKASNRYTVRITDIISEPVKKLNQFNNDTGTGNETEPELVPPPDGRLQSFDRQRLESRDPAEYRRR